MNTNDNRTLARKLKIQSVKRQEGFIRKKLESFLVDNQPTEGGDVYFTYKGPIYPEVKKTLETEGFVVEPLKPATAIGYFGSPLVSIIRISDEIELTEDEIMESEKYAHLPTRVLDNNGHKYHYSSDKPRYKSFAEYDSSRLQQSDDYDQSQNDDSYDLVDFMPKLVEDINSMMKSSIQDYDTNPEDSFVADFSSSDTNSIPSMDTTTPSECNSIPSIEPIRNSLDEISAKTSIPKQTTQSFSSQEKRIQKAQKRQKRGRNGKN